MRLAATKKLIAASDAGVLESDRLVVENRALGD
jgi:hypothetical protein